MKSLQRLIGCIYCLFLSLVTQGRSPETSPVLFDLGGVVFIPDSLKVAQKTGITPFLYYIGHQVSQGDTQAFSRVSIKIRTKILYPFLEKLIPYNPQGLPVYDEYGYRLPQPMVEWLSGRKSGATLRALIQEAVALHSSWFEHSWEKQIVTAITHFMFTPKEFASCTKLLPETAIFMKECAEKGHPVYILSNWDVASFEIIKEQYPDLLSCVSHVVLSGDCGYCKPDPQIYDYILNRYNLTPQDCFFIDDIPANIQAAQKAGIFGALCKNNDIESIKDAYQQWMEQ